MTSATLDLETVRHLAADGYSDGAIGERLGAIRERVRRFRRKHGIPAGCASATPKSRATEAMRHALSGWPSRRRMSADPVAAMRDAMDAAADWPEDADPAALVAFDRRGRMPMRPASVGSFIGSTGAMCAEMGGRGR